MGHSSLSTRLAAGLILVTMLAAGLCQAGSVIYQWKDEQGRLHFTDNPSAVPVQYWNQISQGSRSTETLSPSHGRATRVVVGTGQRAIQVPVSVNRSWTFLAYLDTGATYCQITGEDAQMLGIRLDSQPRVKVIMADGRSLEAPVVTLESVRIGSVELKEVEALVGDLRLLGLNALRQLRVTVDLPNGEVVLETDKRP
jgi:clan AA aspartic protease (TIGR02281 family)